MELSHTRAVDEIFDYFEVKDSVGLNESQITTARQTYGLNGECSEANSFVFKNFCFTELPVEEGKLGSNRMYQLFSIPST